MDTLEANYRHTAKVISDHVCLPMTGQTGAFKSVSVSGHQKWIKRERKTCPDLQKIPILSPALSLTWD